MRLRVWEPFRRVAPFYADFDKWANEAEGIWHPSVDISENENAFVLKAELPGVKREDISIDINNKTLTLKGEKKFEEKTEKENYVRVERSYGSFSRTFALSDKVDTENVKATYKDGVLEVILPKKEEAKPREVKVEVN